MIEAKQRDLDFFVEDDGSEPVKDWLLKLKKRNAMAHARVSRGLQKLSMGYTGQVKFFDGIAELKINYGPGYRVYFGIDGDEIIILIHGGTKKRQQDDINLAKERWQSYLNR